MTAGVATELVVRAFGTPTPQGSHVARRVGARLFVVPVNEKPLKAWRAALKAAAESAMTAVGWLTLGGPVEVQAVFLLARPPSVRRLLPTVPPDLDKLLRSLDAFTDAGVWSDDARVVRIVAEKRYCAGGQKPGARITVRPVDEVIL